MEHIKTWSTRGLAPARALSFWNEAISSAFLKVRTEPRLSASPFQAQLQSRNAGSLSINRLQAQSYRVVCNTDDSQHDWVFINLHQQGKCRLQQHGRELFIPPGALSINVGNSPFVFDFDDRVAMTCLRLPLAGAAARTGRLHDAAARSLPDEAGTHLLRSYVDSLLQNIHAMSARQAELATSCLLDLLALSIDGFGPQQLDRESVRTALFQQACAYIETHLGDPKLDVSQLSAHLKLAPRTLQSLFHEHGATFSASLLESRLLAADRLIANNTYAQLAQVAYAVGFADQSHFNKAFRRRFGITPGERRAAASPVPT